MPNCFYYIFNSSNKNFYSYFQISGETGKTVDRYLVYQKISLNIHSNDSKHVELLKRFQWKVQVKVQ